MIATRISLAVLALSLASCGSPQDEIVFLPASKAEEGGAYERYSRYVLSFDGLVRNIQASQPARFTTSFYLTKEPNPGNFFRYIKDFKFRLGIEATKELGASVIEDVGIHGSAQIIDTTPPGTFELHFWNRIPPTAYKSISKTVLAPLEGKRFYLSIRVRCPGVDIYDEAPPLQSCVLGSSGFYIDKVGETNPPVQITARLDGAEGGPVTIAPFSRSQ